MAKYLKILQKCIGDFASMHRIFYILAFLFSFCSVQGELFRFQANTPIQGFLAPFFNESGEKTWQCSGEQVRYISDAEVYMKKMCITFFQPHRSGDVDMIVRSDLAQISLPEQRASGQTLLTVTHTSYTIVGEDWFWEGKQSKRAFSKIYIGKNASVMFYD